MKVMKSIRIIFEISKVQLPYKCELSLFQQEHLHDAAGGVHPLTHSFMPFTLTMRTLQASFVAGAEGEKDE